MHRASCGHADGGAARQWTPEQIDNLVTLAKANFAEGAEQLKRTVRAVYERKKKQRLARELAVRKHELRWNPFA